MAELPDLTVFANTLSKKFTGKTVERITLTEKRKLNVSEKELRAALEGRELTAVKRAGKTLQLHFSGGDVAR